MSLKHRRIRPVVIAITLAATALTVDCCSAATATAATSRYQIAGSVSVGLRPEVAAIDLTSHLVYVTHSDKTSTSVSVFDGEAAVPKESLITVGKIPAGIAVDQETHKAFVANYGDDTISVFDTRSISPVVTAFHVGQKPNAVTIDQNTHRVFVTLDDGGSVSSFDGTSTMPVISNVKVGLKPLSIAVDNTTHRVFVGDVADKSVYSFDGASSAPTVSQVLSKVDARGIDIDQSTHEVFAAGQYLGSVLHFDGRQSTPTPTAVTLQAGLYAVSVDQANGDVYVANASTNQVSIFNSRIVTPTVSTLATPRGPEGIAIDTATGRAFVPTDDVDSVTIIARADSPTITSGKPPAATVGVPYSFTFQATGIPNPTIGLTSAGLPQGLRFDSATARLEGTATGAPGVSSITVTATNGESPDAVQTYTFEVLPADVDATTPPITPNTTGAATSGGGSTVGSKDGGVTGNGGSSQLAHTGASDTVSIFTAMVALVALGLGLALVRRRYRRNTI